MYQPLLIESNQSNILTKNYSNLLFVSLNKATSFFIKLYPNILNQPYPFSHLESIVKATSYKNYERNFIQRDKTCLCVNDSASLVYNTTFVFYLPYSTPSMPPHAQEITMTMNNSL